MCLPNTTPAFASRLQFGQKSFLLPLWLLPVTDLPFSASYAAPNMITNTLTDQDLISKVIAGDQRAFALLVDRYKAMVFTVAFRIVHNREDAEELAQSAFVKAYRSLADYRQQAKFSTWLYTIVHNLSLSFLRKHTLVTTDMERPSVQHEMESSNHTNAYSYVDGKGRQQILQQAMLLLGGDDAWMISLYYQGEQSLEEIGRIMGIETNNAKVKLHRARLRLKKILENNFAGEITTLINH